MFLRIETLPETLVVGKSMEMSFVNNLTQQLWQSVMPRRSEIKDRINEELISLQLYPAEFSFERFDPTLNFVKWACAAVEMIDVLPEGMETMTIETGLYAVFKHQGLPSEAPKTFGYIFGEWLPNSQYLLDNRPHFEVLGEKYKNNHPDSEEEFWIPIKEKTTIS